MKRRKKAACYAAVMYFSCAGLGFGMLKAAQQTRRTLYGGQPVMAQCIPTLPADDPTEDPAEQAGDYTLILGGGEWTFRLSLPQIAAQAKTLADKLPPCTAKCLLWLAAEAETLADQTAARLSE